MIPQGGEGGGCSGRLQADRLGVRIRKTLLYIEDLDADHLASIVEVENDPGRNLTRIDDRCVIQPQVKGVGFLVEMKPRNIPSMRQKSGGSGDDGTDETGLGGTQPLYLHEEDGLIFAPVKPGDFPGPLVERILPFQLEDYSGPQRNLLRENRMFHDVTIKLDP